MKTNTLAVTVVSLLQLVAAIPSHKHSHPEKHRRDGDVVTVVDTVVVVATKVPEVVVFISDGVPVSTMTEEVNYDPVSMPGLVASSSSSSTSSSAAGADGGDNVGGGGQQQYHSTTMIQPTTTSTTPVANTASAAGNTNPAAVQTTLITSATKATTPAPVVVASSKSSAASAESSGGSTSGGSGMGFTYDPFLTAGGDKTQAQINTDFEAIKNQNDYQFSYVRTYKGDPATAFVLKAARANGWQLMAGISDITPAAISSEVAAIASAVAANDNDWSSIKMIAVGNEEVGQKNQAASVVLAAVSSAKSSMSAYPAYTGGVQTVDTVDAITKNPSLCDDNGGACTVNCHPFFDPNTDCSEAGSFITNQIELVKKALKNPNQQIIITETGWPWDAATNGQAVAGTTQQSKALQAIQAENLPGVVLFSPYNTPWNPVGSQNWGFVTADGATQGNCPSGYGGGY